MHLVIYVVAIVWMMMMFQVITIFSGGSLKGLSGCGAGAVRLGGRGDGDENENENVGRERG